MKRLALGLLLLTAMTAHAQKVYRCVDSRGATYYTEKPGPGCKPTSIDSKPEGAPAAKGSAPAAKPEPLPNQARVRQSGPMPLTPKAHCDGLSNEAARLKAGKSGLPGPAADRRLAGIEKELNKSCR